MIFRFDDISVNTNMDDAANKVAVIHHHYPDAKILYCISPLAHHSWDCGKEAPEKERTFPKILNAYSDFRLFYKVKQCWLPEAHTIPNGVQLASHGLIHTDHRLLTYETQEMSILVSCSLVNSSTFVPPFNKWNHDTVAICNEHHINLIKFEDGWECLEYEKFDALADYWYFHPREITTDALEELLDI